MDFGDILNQWDSFERSQKQKSKEKPKTPQVSHKMPNAPTPQEKEERKRAKLKSQGLLQDEFYARQMKADSEKKINPMEAWLRIYGVTDKDKEADEYNERSKMESRSYLRQMRPEARIDLHGLTRDEAWSKLASFVNMCVSRGLKKILIVHGKGNHSHGSDPVLGPMVKTFIEQNPNLGSSGHPDHSQGGSGATWVIIK